MRSLFVHLRLHFQLLLAPVYLWGWLIAGGELSGKVLLGFVAFHGFLYSGATAFNSSYDRDVGPVGGLEHPPRVTAALLPFSLAVQAIGWVIAAFVNWTFFLAYGLFVVLSVAYSHPRIRWKARTFTSVLVVAFGQGALAYFAAWAATRGEIGSVVSPEGLRGALAAALLIVAFYPLTQLYQMDEDAARGDRTLAVAWGPKRCFAFAKLCTVVGGTTLLAVLAQRFGFADVILVGCGLIAQLVAISWLQRRLDPRQIVRTFHDVMRVNWLSAGALGAYLLLRLASVNSR